MPRAMGLDVGTKTIGVALSDPTYLIAQASETVWRQSLEQDLCTLVAIAKREEVREIVIGLAKHMNNQMSDSARRAMSFGAEWKKMGYEVFFQDERMSTLSAMSMLQKSGVRGRKKQKEHVDAVAAAIILQVWLDTNRSRYAERNDSSL